MSQAPVRQRMPPRQMQQPKIQEKHKQFSLIKRSQCVRQNGQPLKTKFINSKRSCNENQ